MELPAKYNPSQTEDKWYSYWLEHKFFHSEPDSREPYSMIIPPPNVTGVLHMGHMLNNTIQDVLVRRARMCGKNACWVPGTDHASIATEAKVVAKLRAEGISKEDLTREEFLRHAWEWKEKHGGIILEQLKKLGASCDWDRTRFTMEPELSRAVVRTFVHFYKKGLIYRGIRMVNWDPVGLTAVSDEEVIRKETKSKLYYLRYHVSDNGVSTGKYIVVATTRPETIMADAAVCIHPEDERYRWLKGKKVLIPLINREIPVIEDDYVEIGFGTGCLKVTPAHDVNDYAIGQRHNLPVIDIIDEHGKLNDKAVILVGEDRFEARKHIRELLEREGLLEKEEDYSSQVGYSERTDAVIEPRLSMQWFLKMGELAKGALARVEDGEIHLIPDKFRNTYRHWMENVRDWCISRQLWWGQRIPAYYLPDGRFVVENTPEEALEAARKLVPDIKADDLRQDEDVLDTWFPSWLWPISVFDPELPGNPGHEPNADIRYYYPTNDLITAPDILFFWVARMIMAGNEFMGKIPFGNVYLTGTVRDKLGRKMSKSLGADGVRLGMLLCSAAGNDILFDESQVEQGRNFCNKIWNAFRLVMGWKVGEDVDDSSIQIDSSKIAVVWFKHKLNQMIEVVNDHFDKFRLSDALMALYKFFWDDFCAWYLEIVKPAYGKGIDRQVYESTLGFFDALLRLIHPFMPFITEELWQNLAERKDGDTIMLARMPRAEAYDAGYIGHFSMVCDVIASIRNIRQSKGISPKEQLSLSVRGEFPKDFSPVVMKMANISSIDAIDKIPENIQGVSFMVSTTEFFVPLSGLVDTEEEIRKTEEAIAHNERFLKQVRGKLSNERFVANAPQAVVALERKKEADALSKLEALKAALKTLKGE